MTETADKKSAQAKEENTQNKIEDYLTGPRKKRRSYVIFALGKRFDSDIAAGMKQFINKYYSANATSYPKDINELTRQLGRNIALLVIDDEFDDIEVILKLIRAFKEKRREEAIPITFLTKRPGILIEKYHEILAAYHENDDYFVYERERLAKLYERLKHGIENKNHRRSRRYRVNLPINFYRFSTDSWLEGTIIDMSLHGALIRTSEDTTFKPSDQIKLQIPVGDKIPGFASDYLKLSAKTRRIYISGNQFAASFEYVTENQQAQLTKLMTAMVQSQFKRQSAAMRAQDKLNTRY